MEIWIGAHADRWTSLVRDHHINIVHLVPQRCSYQLNSSLISVDTMLGQPS